MKTIKTQRSIQKMVNILHLFHTSLHDFNAIYVDNKKINHIVYNDEDSTYYFDSDNFPDIEEEDLEEIDVPFQKFLDDKYYCYFTEGQVAEIIDHLNDTTDTDTITHLSDYLDQHPNQTYRLYGLDSGYATGTTSAQKIAHREDLEIDSMADKAILDDADGQPYGNANGYPYRELLKYKDTDLVNILEP